MLQGVGPAAVLVLVERQAADDPLARAALEEIGEQRALPQHAVLVDELSGSIQR
jgi:hypothetical protein